MSATDVAQIGERRTRGARLLFGDRREAELRWNPPVWNPRVWNPCAWNSRVWNPRVFGLCGGAERVRLIDVHRYAEPDEVEQPHPVQPAGIAGGGGPAAPIRYRRSLEATLPPVEIQPAELSWRRIDAASREGLPSQQGGRPILSLHGLLGGNDLLAQVVVTPRRVDVVQIAF